MKFRKKPVEIEAIQWNGKSSWEDLKAMAVDTSCFGIFMGEMDDLAINTLEGRMKVSIGDWVIKGVNGEFYPCKPDIFEKTYQDASGGTGSISDGYHTFDELYEHRVALFITLCKILREKEVWRKGEYGNFPWRSKKHSDGEMAFGGTWFVLGIGRKKGEQITYHLPLNKWEQTDFAETLEKAPEWDGHTPADVLERLKNL